MGIVKYVLVEACEEEGLGFRVMVTINSLPMSQFVKGASLNNLQLDLGPDNVEGAAEAMVGYAEDYAKVFDICTALSCPNVTTTRRGDTIKIIIPKEWQDKIGEIVMGLLEEFERPE